jgi:hypothetical protein
MHHAGALTAFRYISVPLPSCFVIFSCHTRAYRTFSYLLIDKFRTAMMMQVPEDTPDELAALTTGKPLEPVAKRVPKKQLKEKVTPRTHVHNGQSANLGIWGLHRLSDSDSRSFAALKTNHLKFI